MLMLGLDNIEKKHIDKKKSYRLIDNDQKIFKHMFQLQRWMFYDLLLND